MKLRAYEKPLPKRQRLLLQDLETHDLYVTPKDANYLVNRENGARINWPSALTLWAIREGYVERQPERETEPGEKWYTLSETGKQRLAYDREVRGADQG